MKKQLWIAVALLALLALPTTLLGQAMEDPEAIVRGLQAAFNAGDVDGALAYYAEDAVVDIRPSEIAPQVPPTKGMRASVPGWKRRPPPTPRST